MAIKETPISKASRGSVCNKEDSEFITKNNNKKILVFPCEIGSAIKPEIYRNETNLYAPRPNYIKTVNF